MSCLGFERGSFQNVLVRLLAVAGNFLCQSDTRKPLFQESIPRTVRRAAGTIKGWLSYSYQKIRTGCNYKRKQQAVKDYSQPNRRLFFLINMEELFPFTLSANGHRNSASLLCQVCQCSFDFPNQAFPSNIYQKYTKKTIKPWILYHLLQLQKFSDCYDKIFINTLTALKVNGQYFNTHKWTSRKSYDEFVPAFSADIHCCPFTCHCS